jgi:hypothetical protein
VRTNGSHGRKPSPRVSLLRAPHPDPLHEAPSVVCAQVDADGGGEPPFFRQPPPPSLLCRRQSDQLDVDEGGSRHDLYMDPCA